MRVPFRRRPPEPLSDIPTRSVAVGSLSGISPADVRANLLIVLDASGNMSLTGVACDELCLTMLTRAAFLVGQRVYAAHAHEGER